MSGRRRGGASLSKHSSKPWQCSTLGGERSNRLPAESPHPEQSTQSEARWASTGVSPDIRDAFAATRSPSSTAIRRAVKLNGIMNRIRVAAAALNQTPLDWSGNRANIIEAIAQARSAGARILCLPELCITGYGCEDTFHSPGVQEMAWRVVQEIVAETADMVVCLGLNHRGS